MASTKSKKSFTDAMVARVAPDPQRRREIPDPGMRGLYLIVQPGGAKSWAVRYRVKGSRAVKKATLGSFPVLSVEAAQDKAKPMLREAGEGKDPVVARRERELAARRDAVETVVARFLVEHVERNRRPATLRDYKRLLERDVLPLWKGRTLQSITRGDIVEVRNRVAARGALFLANRVVAALGSLLNWAVDNALIEVNVAARVKKATAEVARDRTLADAELTAVLAAAGELGMPFGPIIKLLALTGARREEVGGLRWSELDLAAATWTLPAERAKNGKPHVVPLSAPVLGVLNELPSTGGDFVFGLRPPTGWSHAKANLDRLIAASGFEMQGVWRVHDIRRTTVTGMHELGIAPHIVEAVVNHISGHKGGVAGVYNKATYATEKRVALVRWGDHVAQLVGAAPEGADNITALRRTAG